MRIGAVTSIEERNRAVFDRPGRFKSIFEIALYLFFRSIDRNFGFAQKHPRALELRALHLLSPYRFAASRITTSECSKPNRRREEGPIFLIFDPIPLRH